jgi:hypothetical protein
VGEELVEVIAEGVGESDKEFGAEVVAAAEPNSTSCTPSPSTLLFSLSLVHRANSSHLLSLSLSRSTFLACWRMALYSLSISCRRFCSSSYVLSIAASSSRDGELLPLELRKRPGPVETERERKVQEEIHTKAERAYFAWESLLWEKGRCRDWAATPRISHVRRERQREDEATGTGVRGRGTSSLDEVREMLEGSSSSGT